MINIDDRLKLCAEFVSGNGIAVDVGTDHAYLAVYLISNKICKKTIACDLRERPLESARKHISNEGFEDKIETILSDGLEKVSPDNVSDIIIAGMGGELIARIISKAEWVSKNKINLILQPMTKAHDLRKFLFENGFKIKDEKAVRSEQFIYSVINAEYSDEPKSYEAFELYCGGLNFNRETDREYLSVQADRLINAGSGMLKSENKNDDIISKGKEKIKIGRLISDRLDQYRKD